ncbi:hypothetical protein Sango_3091600 [Sesamum angolense]|uniref:Uncharacterized protein n=1 Tax=Sesamum angolense TaxID=2727404 RepID=A0AAE1W0E4_9LAMI|nr:hypothetical protein Sango_3091600 [Sesamum angolense]
MMWDDRDRKAFESHAGPQSNVSVQDEDCDLQPGDESLLVNGGREPCEFIQSTRATNGPQLTVSVQDEDSDLQPGDESIPKDSLGDKLE